MSPGRRPEPAPQVDRPVRRLLFVVTHFHATDGAGGMASRTQSAQQRAQSVMRCVTSLHETFGPASSVSPGTMEEATPGNVVDVVLVTTGGQHLLDLLDPVASLFRHVEMDAAPEELGFAVHRVLEQSVSSAYDFYCYIEDDGVLRDPMFFDKLAWFTRTFGAGSLLLPNRFEVSGGRKVYPDGPLPPEATARITAPAGPSELRGRWGDVPVRFAHPSNPHAAGFFVDAEQFDRLRAWEGFGRPGAQFITSLETAATYAVSHAFRVFKPVMPRADFLELCHDGSRYLGEWGIPSPAHVATAARLAAEQRTLAAEAELRAMRASTSWRLTAPARRLRARRGARGG